jgi:hypothetical protein
MVLVLWLGDTSDGVMESTYDLECHDGPVGDGHDAVEVVPVLVRSERNLRVWEEGTVEVLKT